MANGLIVTFICVKSVDVIGIHLETGDFTLHHQIQSKQQARSQDFAQGGGGHVKPEWSDQSHDHICPSISCHSSCS